MLNVNRPFPVAARHTVGHMLPDLVFGCLNRPLPEGMPARDLLAVNPQINGGGSIVDELPPGIDPASVPSWSTVIFHCGGAGARPDKDGLSATAFPSGVRAIPIEATGTCARRCCLVGGSFVTVSGGAGKWRGGLGQVIEIGGADGMPISLLCNFERVEHPARGRSGGQAGAPGRVSLLSGRPIGPKGRQTVPGGDMIRLELPGGGGYGNPRSRDPALAAADVADGLVSPYTAARNDAVTLPPKPDA